MVLTYSGFLRNIAFCRCIRSVDLWRISNEPFMKDFKKIDNLVIRASYGVQGNIDKSTSSYVMGNYNNVSILPDVTEEMIVLGNSARTNDCVGKRQKQ